MSRNAIKYQPFSALDGYFDSIADENENLNDVDKPILSEDDCIRINDNLCSIINNNLVGKFYIFKNKRILEIESKVNKVLNGVLYLDEVKININDIVDIII